MRSLQSRTPLKATQLKTWLRELAIGGLLIAQYYLIANHP
jgi:hypothetical protein